jgi:mannose-1-phosphate guanylyltransferase/mannose-6-phosphate isomerase
MTWTIVLAGGNGTRLLEESRRRFGVARPKQFCDFDGNGTLLSRTIERARRFSAGSRIVVITTRDHRDEAERALADHPDVVRIEQPRGKDTTPGILLPLLHVLAWDPAAPVVLLPADHHVAQERIFSAAIHDALDVVRNEPRRRAVIGAEPTDMIDDYGWLLPDGDGPNPGVAAFREKPAPDERARLHAQGALVNTFVLAARARTLGAVIASRAGGWWRTLTNMRHGMRLEAAYDMLPPSNFSRDVLERIPERLALVPLAAEAGWSDIGTPDRLARALGSAAPAPRMVIRRRASAIPRRAAVAR